MGWRHRWDKYACPNGQPRDLPTNRQVADALLTDEVFLSLNNEPAHINPSLTRAQAHKVFVDGTLAAKPDVRVSELIAMNIFREFGEIIWLAAPEGVE